VSNPELWLDSDVAWSITKVTKLATLAKRKGITVFVHAHVHLEQCRQIRERATAAKPYAPERINSFLDQLDIKIAEAKIDRATAEAWAELLYNRHPKEVDWKRAKLSSVRARLPDEASVTAAKVPFTTDWLVALEVERRGAFIAVEDKGEEWLALRESSPKRALFYNEAIAWLEAQDDAAPRT
jgi:hypothetical protein